MTRPSRYPYTKNQWEETTTAVYSYNKGEYELFRGLESKFTGERAKVISFSLRAKLFETFSITNPKSYSFPDRFFLPANCQFSFF